LGEKENTKMVDSAPAKANGRDVSAPRAVARNLSELLRDMFTLADLQARLAYADTQRLMGDLVYPGALLLAGVVIALSCLPIALVAIAVGLDEATQLTLGQALGFTVAGGLVVGAGVALGAVLWIRRGLRPFERSLAECDLNMRWIKRLLEEQASSSRRATSFRAEDSGEPR
jgi:hypothetical protein